MVRRWPLLLNGGGCFKLTEVYLQLFRLFDYWPLKRWPLNGGSTVYFNTLGPKSVQHQFFLNNISRSTRVKVMRITKLMTKGRMLWSFIKFSQLFLKEMYGDQFGEFVFGSWGLIKGLIILFCNACMNKHSVNAYVVFGCVRRSTSNDLSIISTGSKPLRSLFFSAAADLLSLMSLWVFNCSI